jgi:hypothetical protein
MNKKPHNLTGIENELRGASLFFAKGGAKEVTEGSQVAQDEAQAATQVSQVLLPLKGQFSEKSHREAISLPTANEPSNKAPNETPVERRVEASLQRTKVRHTFDIFKDQLAALRKIQFERAERFDKRYLLGDLVQEALDMFITKQRNNQ